MGALLNGLIPNPARPPFPQTMGSKSPPFEIAAKRLEIKQNINRARLIRYFLALK